MRTHALVKVRAPSINARRCPGVGGTDVGKNGVDRCDSVVEAGAITRARGAEGGLGFYY